MSIKKFLPGIFCTLLLLFALGLAPAGLVNAQLITVTADAATLPLPDLQESAFPSLQSFSQSLYTGQPEQVVGLYAPGILAFPVVQQPAQDPGFVSTADDTLTQFSLASQYGVIGLLAHNYLAGASFSRLEVGQVITLIYGDGKLKDFKVYGIDQFQALSPTSPYSNFIDLDDPGIILTSTELFHKVYALDAQLVLQTCLEAEGDPSWGRQFIFSEPVEEITAVAAEMPGAGPAAPFYTTFSSFFSLQ